MLKYEGVKLREGDLRFCSIPTVTVEPMKRLDEKVKDIVEVRESPSLSDFLADPAATIDGYHFTDITSDLMSKWIDRITSAKQGNGDAMALAGYRGVGKSHFLAVLGAIVAQPELRARISDSHISSSAQRLSRRHGVVAYVRRGSGDSLLSELKDAVAQSLGGKTGTLSDSVSEIFRVAAGKSGDLPFTVLIDTASDRETRVARDDGSSLSEIAELAKQHGIFVGIALDDDIAGADGMNSSIVSSFAIDYLDQEHLYKIVNAYVFAKRDQMRPLLHEIYESYREALPAFRWSEHRFLSLYPLHPAILEIAPFIRLYLHDFALLGFASDAGVKILGRPANSLIGMDEVFDSIEERLRKVVVLKEAFGAYDFLDRSVISQMPVMKRHEAKLILKGLFLLSFNDENISAKELCATMLILDDSGSGDRPAEVEGILRSFSEACSDFIYSLEGDGVETKFGFNLGSKDDLKSALDEVGEEITDGTIQSILRQQTSEKFADYEAIDDDAAKTANHQIIWRGALRAGRLDWPVNDETIDGVDRRRCDWIVKVSQGPAKQSEDTNAGCVTIEWRLADLSNDELATFRRFHILQNDSALREKYRDSISTAIHVHSIAVEKIWQRIFLEDSRLIADGVEYTFSEEAISSHTLEQLFTVMLAGVFESRFPSHPVFIETLTEGAVSFLTEHLFSGSGVNNPEVQALAANVAYPLGLVNETDGLFLPVSGDELATLDVFKHLFKNEQFDQAGVIPLSDLSNRMLEAPYGLTEEAQHLILAAFVAQRRYEFVTSSGNRIHHRSLDLQIVWDDIVGIAQPSTESYSDERLVTWAVLVTGDAALKSLKSSEAKTKLVDALYKWLDEFRESGVLEKFESLADEKLNSTLWRIASNVKKTFGVAADSIDTLRNGSGSIDECLQIIADVFCDSEDEYKNKYKDLLSLKGTVEGATDRDDVYSYLVHSDSTKDPEVERLRVLLLSLFTKTQAADNQASHAEFNEKWERYKTGYIDQYSIRHDTVMGTASDRGKLDEFLKTDAWSVFAELSAIPLFGSDQMDKALVVIREVRKTQCDADVRAILNKQPSCACDFSLTKGLEVNMLIGKLSSIITTGLNSFSHKLLTHRNMLSAALKKIGVSDEDVEAILNRTSELPVLSAPQIQFLKSATAGLAVFEQSRTGVAQPQFETLSDLLLENELNRMQNIAEIRG